MQVSATSSALAMTQTASTERTEKRENDGDGDDKGAARVSSPAQSVNLNGQATGQVIHATA